MHIVVACIEALNEASRILGSKVLPASESRVSWTHRHLGAARPLHASNGFGCRWVGHEFPINTALAIFGSFISYIYSAPPLKLKKEGWTGNYALGSSYIALPWWAGQALFGTLTPDVVVLTILYSWAGLGIAVVNDFKSIEGDRALGLQSLPVAFGIEKAKYICAGSIDITQLSVAAYLWLGLGKPVYAAVLLGLVLPQVCIFFHVFKLLLRFPLPVVEALRTHACQRMLVSLVCIENCLFFCVVS
jgi:bacteriochlorophyll/chlorophyll synthetase